MRLDSLTFSKMAASSSSPHKRKRVDEVARVPTLRELAFQAAASSENILESLKTLPDSFHGELLVRSTRQIVAPMQAELKSLCTQVAKLEHEKVSWCQEVLTMPEEKKACRRDEAELTGFHTSRTRGPLSLNRCYSCGVTMATVLQAPFNPRTSPACDACVTRLRVESSPYRR